MTDITPDVAASLTTAGINKRLHQKTLASLGPVGLGAVDWLREHGAAVREGSTSVLFVGPGLTDVMVLLARGLHINGVGCRVTPLVRMRRVINDAEFREDIREIDCLVVLNAQDRHRGNPLHDAVAAEVEYLLRERYDQGRSTFLQVAFEGELDRGDDRSYWSDSFWDMVSMFEHVTEAMLRGRVS